MYTKSNNKHNVTQEDDEIKKLKKLNLNLNR